MVGLAFGLIQKILSLGTVIFIVMVLCSVKVHDKRILSYFHHHVLSINQIDIFSKKVSETFISAGSFIQEQLEIPKQLEIPISDFNSK